MISDIEYRVMTGTTHERVISPTLVWPAGSGAGGSTGESLSACREPNRELKTASLAIDHTLGCLAD